MAKKKSETPKKITRASLKSAAEELNDVLGLEPEIDVKAPDFEIIDNLVEAMQLIEEGDEISEETMQVLDLISKSEGLEESKETQNSEEAEEPEEEFEETEEVEEPEEELEEEIEPEEEFPEQKTQVSKKTTEVKKKTNRTNRTKEMMKFILRKMTDGVGRNQIRKLVAKEFPEYKQSTIDSSISNATLYKEIENEGY